MFKKNLLITGLPGSGKTTLAKDITDSIKSSEIINLDGDLLRKCWPNLGYSNFDRQLNQQRILAIAGALSSTGTVIISSIFPSKEYRQILVNEYDFHEVLLDMSWVKRPASYTPVSYEYNDYYTIGIDRLIDSDQVELFKRKWINDFSTKHIEFAI